MDKALFFFAVIVALISCKKSDDPPPLSGNKATPMYNEDLRLNDFNGVFFTSSNNHNSI